MAANERPADGWSPSPAREQGMMRVIQVIQVLVAVVLRNGGAPTCWLGWRLAHLRSIGVDWERRQGREEGGPQVTCTSA